MKHNHDKQLAGLAVLAILYALFLAFGVVTSQAAESSRVGYFRAISAEAYHVNF